jgi:signal transduction histidine kinase
MSEDVPHERAGAILWSQALQRMAEPSLTVLNDGKILEANLPAARVLGYSDPTGLRGSRLSDVLDLDPSGPGADELLVELRANAESDNGFLLLAAPTRDPLGVGKKELVMWPINGGSRFAMIYHALGRPGGDAEAAPSDDHRLAYADLLYAVSHDLQEPLQLITRYAKVLEEARGRDLGGKAAQFLTTLLGNANRMQSMLDDLLEFARLERASALTTLDLQELVRNVVSLFQPKLKEIGGRVRWKDLPQVVADRAQIARVLQNLIGNCIKFHGDEPLDVRIASRAQNDCVELVVEDNGIGIDPAKADVIFGMFKRLHTQAEYPGTGMGLAICRRIVGLHGGRIWARPKSKSSHGLAVHFTLCTKQMRGSSSHPSDEREGEPGSE